MIAAVLTFDHATITLRLSLFCQPNFLLLLFTRYFLSNLVRTKLPVLLVIADCSYRLTKAMWLDSCWVHLYLFDPNSSFKSELGVILRMKAYHHLDGAVCVPDLSLCGWNCFQGHTFRVLSDEYYVSLQQALSLTTHRTDPEKHGQRQFKICWKFTYTFQWG